jgi:hypothetical protein
MVSAFRAESGHLRSIVRFVKGDRVEALVDTGQGVQTFEIVATRAGRRIEVVTSRGVVEVREATRTGQPVRTGPLLERAGSRTGTWAPKGAVSSGLLKHRPSG